MDILNKIKSLFNKNDGQDNKSDYEGFIGYFNLDQWWKKTFSDEEKEYIISKKPELIKGSYNYIDKSPAQYLQEISLWFNTKKDSEISLKLLNKSEDFVDNILDKHFIYLEMIKTNYKKRNEDDKFYNQAIIACEKQIEIADKAMKEFKKEYKERIKKTYKLYEDEFTFEEYKEKDMKEHPFHPVSHRGYKQLAIIKHKKGKYREVINLCKKAKKQGWRGDWDKRIERAKNKLDN